jgi:hypothetical protein
MSSRHHEEPFAAQRFFHAMVIMGGSLALGCGGAASGDPGGESSGGAPVVGSGGSGGVPVTTGGSAPMATGGIPAMTSGGSSGGQFHIASGGTVDPGPFPCPPAQFDCLRPGTQCQGSGYALPNDCVCNPQRPASAGDCGADQSFVCRKATHNVDFVEFTAPVPFECSCVPRQTSCMAACDTAYGVPGVSCRADAEDPRSILCGCAVIVLR